MIEIDKNTVSLINHETEHKAIHVLLLTWCVDSTTTCMVSYLSAAKPRPGIKEYSIILEECHLCIPSGTVHVNFGPWRVHPLPSGQTTAAGLGERQVIHGTAERNDASSMQAPTIARWKILISSNTKVVAASISFLKFISFDNHVCRCKKF